MADHGHIEYATAGGNDLPEHEATYDRFVHLVFVGSAHVANILLGLAVGGLTDHWLVAFGIFVLATIVGFHGFLTGARAPSAVMLLLSLLALAFTAGSGSTT
jgi:hypothetical protein